MNAIALAEGAISQRILAIEGGLHLPRENAFGEPVVFEQGPDVRALARRCGEFAQKGERVTLIARASDLTTARSEFAAIASRRLAVVVHVIAEAGDARDPAPMVGLAPALALDDLPWGMLLGAGAADAIDLALIARRAAEDSGCPFFVVHERVRASDAESVAAPPRDLCEGFIGAAGSAAARLGRSSVSAGGASHGSDRAFAERVPFALASAMRELEPYTGRHHDFIERSPGPGAAVALVGAGVLGRRLLAEVSRLRESGHDIAAVRVVAWRPFPAPQLVKALGRALAITVLERVDQPLASNSPLAAQIKAAFADAMTWAPDYPGVGRIPRIVSGFVERDVDLGSADIDAIVKSLHAGDHEKRHFVVAISWLGGAPPTSSRGLR